MDAKAQADRPDLAALLPREAVVVVATSKHQVMPLLAAESDHFAHRSMHPRRMAEVQAGRACAREALGHFGFSQWSLLPAATREPLWPAGIVGSITHADGYCAVAVAATAACTGLGIDVETPSRIGHGVEAGVCRREELKNFDRCQIYNRSVLLSLAFSAKESVFKAIFPATRIFLDFKDVAIDFEFATRKFTARAPGCSLDKVLNRLKGRFDVGRKQVMTTAVYCLQ